MRALMALSALALIAAACGDSSGDGDSDQADSSVVDDAESTAPATDDSDDADAPADEPEADAEPVLEGELVGLFSVDATECTTAGSESGSYFRMVSIGGAVDDGPFIPNGDSTCADQTFIEMTAGTDGGPIPGVLQRGAEPLSDDPGHAAPGPIPAPTVFFAVAFAMATTDEAPPPMIIATSGELSGDVSSVSAYYAGLIFNQGAPKPDGSTPGITSSAPSGSIDLETGEYTLEWASQIVGGAFNEFTGIWHLEGTFTPAG